MKVDKFISHRGAKTDHVENTIKAFEISRINGFNWFEIDVQMSADGELFLFHDDDLKRLAGLDLKPTQMTWSELQSIDLNHLTLGAIDKIPTLKEYLDWTVVNNLFTNVEIKVLDSAGEDYIQKLVTKVISLLDNYDDIKKYIFISSFSKLAMRALKKYKKYRKGKLFYTTSWSRDFEYLDTKLYRHYKDNDYMAIIINYDCLNRKRMQYLKSKFGKVFVYSVYTDYEVNKLLEWNVDAMFIDKKEQRNITL
ncbi:glycerophosphodiester phosphodiesterase family protein [Francisellaceae bacterium CB300]